MNTTSNLPTKGFFKNMIFNMVTKCMTMNSIILLLTEHKAFKFHNFQIVNVLWVWVVN
jgi:hypothetical protein